MSPMTIQGLLPVFRKRHLDEWGAICKGEEPDKLKGNMMSSIFYFPRNMSSSKSCT